VQLPPAQDWLEAICTHTPSSGNVREAQGLRIARVTFPQRLHIGQNVITQRGTNLFAAR
jgi:hypothetical protein